MIESALLDLASGYFEKVPLPEKPQILHLDPATAQKHRQEVILIHRVSFHRERIQQPAEVFQKRALYHVAIVAEQPYQIHPRP